MKQKLKLKYQIEFAKHVEEMSNRKLLAWVIEMAGGDDYDGDFTAHGYWKFHYAERELYNRLKGWFQDES